jgi:Protein of unknown function (DUF3015)
LEEIAAMRTLIATTALALALATPAALAQQDETANSTGCGVGTILFDGQKGPVPQILAVTTNGTLGNQTFGISSGTLGCTQEGVVRPPTKVRMLLMSSLDSLAGDVARGDGETLQSLASLLAVEEQDRPRFFVALQDNFVRIFPSENVTADEVLVSVNAVLAEDPVLSRYVFA